MRLLIKLLILAGLLFIQTNSLAQFGLHAKVVSVAGKAQVQDSYTGAWKDAAVDMVLNVGDKVKTGSDGIVEISLSEEDKDIFKIEPDTTIEIKIVSDKLKVVDLPLGTVYGYVSDLNRGVAFEVRTPTATAGARGTGWMVSYDGESNEIFTFERNVYVKSFNESGQLVKEVTLGQGFSVDFANYSPPGMFRKISNEQMNKFNSWQGSFSDRIPYFQNLKKNILEIKAPDQYRQEQNQQMDDFKNRYRYDQPGQGYDQRRRGWGFGGWGR